MAAKKKFKADIETAAEFLQARAGTLIGGEDRVVFDFNMLDFETPTTVGLNCSVKHAQKLVHTTLAALASLGDQPASVLLKVLNKPRGEPFRFQ